MKKLATLILFSSLLLTACSSSQKSEQSQSKQETVQSSVQSNEVEEAEVISEFNPTDSNDETIESIETYNDYLIMYEFIVHEYIDNYEATVKELNLPTDDTYQLMKEQTTASLEEAKEQYGLLKDSKIVGKEMIVEMLKSYRDELKAYTDQLSNAF